MFTKKELQQLNSTHLTIINAGCYSVTLQSKNTKHYWHILEQEYSKFTSCRILLKHSYSDVSHEQCSVPPLMNALNEIKSHDNYQLCVRSSRKGRNYRIA